MPPALDAAILRLLAKNPADRPADAGAARAVLLAAVPVAGAPDRTAELLAATRALPPITEFPPFQGGHADPQRTSVLPPLPPLPPTGPATADHGEPRPQPQRRRPLVVAGVGVAVVAGAAAIAAFALGGPGGRAKAGPTVASSSAATAPSLTAPFPSATPSPSRTSPTPSAKPGPAGVLAALRTAVAQTQFAKERDRQADLLGYLDDAAGALAEHRPQQQDEALRNAQRLIRDLVKKHAVDNGTAQNWQSRINSLLAGPHTQSQNPSQSPAASTSSRVQQAQGSDSGQSRTGPATADQWSVRRAGGVGARSSRHSGTAVANRWRSSGNA